MAATGTIYNSQGKIVATKTNPNAGVFDIGLSSSDIQLLKIFTKMKSVTSKTVIK